MACILCQWLMVMVEVGLMVHVNYTTSSDGYTMLPPCSSFVHS